MNAVLGFIAQWARRNGLMISVVLGTIMVMILMGVQIARLGSSSTSNVVAGGSGMDTLFWVCALLVLAGAVAAVLNRGGAPARWSLGIIAVSAGAVLLSGVLFGDRAPEVRRALQDGMTKTVLDPARKADVPPATASTQAVKQEAKWERMADGSIPVGVWQPWTKVPSDSCVLFRDVRLEQIELKDNERDAGIDWNAYHKNGKRTFDYFRLKSDGRSLVLKYEFRPWGTCS